MLKLGLVMGLLITLVALLGGCLPGQQAPQQQQGGFDWTVIVFLVVIFAVFYFLMIRPQRKRQKEHQQLTQGLKRGDRVITAGGIYGEIDVLDEESVVLKIESGGRIRVARSSILGVRQR